MGRRSLLSGWTLGLARATVVGDVLVFESAEFSVEPPTDERGVQYDMPLGDDVASYLRSRLGEVTTDWEFGDPVREDFGSVLLISRGKRAFTVTVSWQGDYAWALVFGQMRGCIGWLFSQRPEAEPLRQIKILVQDVVFGEPSRFMNARWIRSEEFPGLASAAVIPKE